MTAQAAAGSGSKRMGREAGLLPGLKWCDASCGFRRRGLPRVARKSSGRAARIVEDARQNSLTEKWAVCLTPPSSTPAAWSTDGAAHIALTRRPEAFCSFRRAVTRASFLRRPLAGTAGGPPARGTPEALVAGRGTASGEWDASGGRGVRRAARPGDEAREAVSGGALVERSPWFKRMVVTLNGGNLRLPILVTQDESHYRQIAFRVTNPYRGQGGSPGMRTQSYLEFAAKAASRSVSASTGEKVGI